MPAGAIRTMICALAVAGLAGTGAVRASGQGADAEAASLAGRFVSTRSGETFDLTPCGAAWCGIRVDPSGRCGDSAMRLEVRAFRAGLLSLEGRFDRQPGGNRHAVVGTLRREPGEGTIALRLYGEPGDSLRYIRRMFPYAETFLSRGEARCRLEDATS